MKQYLYLDPNEDYDHTYTLYGYINIINNKEYDEKDLIKINNFIKPMDDFGISINGKSYVSFCNVLDNSKGKIRNVICCHKI